LDAGEVFVERGVLAGEAHLGADRGGVGGDVVAEDARGARVGAQQGGQHPDGGGLPRAVGPEHAVDRPGRDGQVDAVDGLDLLEVLDEPFGPDRGVAVRHDGLLDGFSLSLRRRYTTATGPARSATSDVAVT